MIVLIVVFAVTTVSMQGCAASKSHEHRAVLEHQTEGRLVYREADGIEYFVECRYGLKYVGSSVSEEVIGPIDYCTGEEE